MNQFSQNMVSRPPTSTVSMPHHFKHTCKIGQLIPIFVKETLPGDYFEIKANTFARAFPLVTPPMHNVNITLDWYSVPMRLVWPKFPRWLTGDYEAEFPYMNIPTDFHVGDLGDFLKYPCSTDQGGADNPAAGVKVSPHRLAAYSIIFHEYYRDQNLIAYNEDYILSDGDNNTIYQNVISSPPSQRAWPHDYFTSCLPTAQKGDEVVLPLGSFSDVDVILDVTNFPTVPGMRMRQNDEVTGSVDGNLQVFSGGGAVPGLLTDSSGFSTFLDPAGNLKAETSGLQAQADSIAQVRRAFMLQEFLERNNRGGTRYNEFVLAHFDTVTPDARINRPEFLGRHVQRVSFSEVLSTTETLNSSDQVNTPVGYLAGHGIAAGGSPRIKYVSREHCVLMCIASIRPASGYMQGVERALTRFDRYDYPFPSFAHIGDQAVLNKEIYAAHSDPDGTFGYIPRYSEERFISSHVSGSLKTTLDFWSLDRKFSSDVALNQSFVYINTDDVNRIFADTTGDHFIMNHSFSVKRRMRLPRFGVPQI